MATLTFAYADSTVVVGPLARASEPHSYDLCAAHAGTMTAPKGWDIVRPTGEFATPQPGPDDLEALVDAVREAEAASAPPPAATEKIPPRRGHLRVLHFPTE